ncbi:MAG: stage IV sporulation protein A, partial [Oscillospiraceae bacterium]|nr:stage IV sporulation protein A [Oscillospiraceae bacterium]
MDGRKIYEDIALRTDGDIYIGVVGPVRTGKSTFIKRFMETLVIPNIENIYMRERARDELPQSGSGRTIMTAEPKFVPEDAVQITLDGGAAFSVRLIDCVGYMVNGAVGQFEGDAERMVTTPWFDSEITITQAAETGTRKVITDHSTVGIVVTTDGTITDIDRASYIDAEERVVRELQELGKPFLILINSVEPTSLAALALQSELSEKYGVTCLVRSCLDLTGDDITEIIKSLLYEFPVRELRIRLPEWLGALPPDNAVRAGVMESVRAACEPMYRIRDVEAAVAALSESGDICSASVTDIDLGSGSATASADLPRRLFYSTISEQSGLDIESDGDLVALLTETAEIRREYDRIAPALEDVRSKGYAVIMPDSGEMNLEEPEVVRQNGRYAVRLKASAPSIHLIRADIETEVSPAVGGENSSEEIISL